MELNQLANEIRLSLTERADQLHYRYLNDEQTVREAITCRDCGEPLCDDRQLNYAIDRASDGVDFANRIHGFSQVGHLSETEQTLVQRELDDAIWRGVGRVVERRNMVGIPVPNHVVTALLFEVGTFTKAYFRNADR